MFKISPQVLVRTKETWKTRNTIMGLLILILDILIIEVYRIQNSMVVLIFKILASVPRIYWTTI